MISSIAVRLLATRLVSAMDLEGPPSTEIIDQEAYNQRQSILDEIGGDIKPTDVSVCSSTDEEDDEYITDMQEEERAESSSHRFPISDMNTEISRIMTLQMSHKIVSGFNTVITRKDLGRLIGKSGIAGKKGRWLNDEIINYYLEMIEKRSNTMAGPKVKCMSTFLFPNMKPDLLTKQDWTSKTDPFNYNLVFIPIHSNNPDHWFLATIDIDKKVVQLYDSLSQNSRVYGNVFNVLCQYLKEIYWTKRNELLGDIFQLEVKEDVPKQQDTINCGVFLLNFSEYLSRNADFDFDTSDMSFFRNRMVLEIFHQLLVKGKENPFKRRVEEED